MHFDLTKVNAADLLLTGVGARQAEGGCIGVEESGEGNLFEGEGDVERVVDEGGYFNFEEAATPS